MQGLSPNICVLDFARFRLNDGAWSEEAEILRVDGMVRDTVGIERRGGEMLQPWFAHMTDKTVYGKVQLEFSFDIETMPASNLFGPLHFAPRFYDACGPGCFVTEGDEWTDDYALTDSGLHGITLTKYRACNK